MTAGRSIPAAAVNIGDTVIVGGDPDPVTVSVIHNGTPYPGRIVWETEDLEEIEVGGAEPVSVVALGEVSKRLVSVGDSSRRR